MPVKNPEQLKTISVIVTEVQDRELRAIQEERSTPYATASFASVVREVIAVGLEVFHRDSDSPNETSPKGQAA